MEDTIRSSSIIEPSRDGERADVAGERAVKVSLDLAGSSALLAGRNAHELEARRSIQARQQRGDGVLNPGGDRCALLAASPSSCQISKPASLPLEAQSPQDGSTWMQKMAAAKLIQLTVASAAPETTCFALLTRRYTYRAYQPGAMSREPHGTAESRARHR
ncbi:uncharacterized protein BDR25DRAFT_383371 [Lindgomyces ingoldianus]|uniref:Uncharacterized protein n=1 Tax=Lindgomyces ingoldianus TaxID=673940 RepID=A0ACB6QA16_9PLEO|nr:uncharacterized protein BDR25DRAFT_383371 [Lindgomyces ingoldianus]KAF2463756.1 hypothetical protein BDR25DRAFT_383371 [Lindgomyces ingoldianus]